MKTFQSLLSAVAIVGIVHVEAFQPSAGQCRFASNVARAPATSALSSTETDEETTAAAVVPSIEPKEAVKLFGRLAEKYIMLDDSGGMCCYSACKDCEYRLPDGGYKMADQSASRPKWIPTYEQRKFENLGKEHEAKWRTSIYSDDVTAVTQDEFVAAILEMDFATPLGGPFVSKSAGKMEDTAAAAVLFDVLADGSEKLARRKMSRRLQELSDGEQGLTWPNFSAALGVE
mmetsp:Transcript_9244/g.24969  ORF Transcript_9244/g.24969 Transcript_9244/m.24969 type:complete len:231 (-) Transcript_9244:184-876(-)